MGVEEVVSAEAVAVSEVEAVVAALAVAKVAAAVAEAVLVEAAAVVAVDLAVVTVAAAEAVAVAEVGRRKMQMIFPQTRSKSLWPKIAASASTCSVLSPQAAPLA